MDILIYFTKKKKIVIKKLKIILFKFARISIIKIQNFMVLNGMKRIIAIGFIMVKKTKAIGIIVHMFHLRKQDLQLLNQKKKFVSGHVVLNIN